MHFKLLLVFEKAAKNESTYYAKAGCEYEEILLINFLIHIKVKDSNNRYSGKSKQKAHVAICETPLLESYKVRYEWHSEADRAHNESQALNRNHLKEPERYPLSVRDD